MDAQEQLVGCDIWGLDEVSSKVWRELNMKGWEISLMTDDRGTKQVKGLFKARPGGQMA